MTALSHHRKRSLVLDAIHFPAKYRRSLNAKDALTPLRGLFHYGTGRQNPPRQPVPRPLARPASRADGRSPTAIHKGNSSHTRVHQIDQPLAGRLLNGSLSGQISRFGEARGSADVGGSPLSMFDGSIDSPRATRADCRSGLISRLSLLSASASKCEISRSLVK